MVSTYHANATTTARVREEIRQSKESIATLADRYCLNPKTVMKWRHADGCEDKRSGPQQPKSALSELEQQVICEFRRKTRLSLDDVYIALKDQIPALTRSNLHRCLKRHGLSVLPKEESSTKPPKQKFSDYSIGYVHVDITEIILTGGLKLYLFVCICRISKYVYCELHPNMTMKIACSFFENAIAECPFKIHRVLTDNGTQFTYQAMPEHLRPKDQEHLFDILCKKHDIKHKLTKFRHPWTNGQVEIFNKAVKGATIRQFHYDTPEELKKHIMSFLLVYNFQKKLRALKYQTPYDFILKTFDEQPTLFKENPYHKIVGLNS
jgi:Integrase core domain